MVCIQTQCIRTFKWNTEDVEGWEMNEPSQKEEVLEVQVSRIFWRAEHSMEENSRLQEGQVTMTLIESISYYISGTVLRAPLGTSFKDQKSTFPKCHRYPILHMRNRGSERWNDKCQLGSGRIKIQPGTIWLQSPKLRATLYQTAMKWRSSVRNRVLAGGNTVLPMEPETEQWDILVIPFTDCEALFKSSNFQEFFFFFFITGQEKQPRKG